MTKNEAINTLLWLIDYCLGTQSIPIVWLSDNQQELNKAIEIVKSLKDKKELIK